MFKKIFLLITTILVAISVSTGFDSPDILKGAVNAELFLDWFTNTEKSVHVKGIIVFDLIPSLFLIIQVVFFFRDNKKVKGLFTVLALLANFVGVFIAVQYAYPLASQIHSWAPEKLPQDWINLKDDWLNYIGLYGLTGVVGWLCFVITYFVSEEKNTAQKRLPRFLNFTKNGLLFFLTFTLGLSAARLYTFFFFPLANEISGVTFIEMHRPIDLAIRKAGPIVFTFILSLQVLLTTLFFMERSNKKGTLMIATIIFLLCDTFIALQYNRPLNDLFNTWTPATIPSDWASLRYEWLTYHIYRDIFMILEFVSILLVFFVPKTKHVTKHNDTANLANDF